MSFILQNVGLVWKGARPTSVESILPGGEVFTIGGVAYTWDKLIVLLFTVPVLFLLIWLVQSTRQGKAMRATAQDRDASAMMGINVNRTISFTFLLAGGLAGAAGLLYALYITNVRYDEGFRLGLIAFTAAVVGGIGNLPGAVLGGLLIAMVESFNNGLGWATPGQRLDAVDHLRDPDHHPGLPAGGPARRADARRRLTVDVSFIPPFLLPPNRRRAFAGAAQAPGDSRRNRRGDRVRRDRALRGHLAVADRGRTASGSRCTSRPGASSATAGGSSRWP